MARWHQWSVDAIIVHPGPSTTRFTLVRCHLIKARDMQWRRGTTQRAFSSQSAQSGGFFDPAIQICTQRPVHEITGANEGRATGRIASFHGMGHGAHLPGGEHVKSPGYDNTEAEKWQAHGHGRGRSP